jgi:hypothetical protein
MRCSFGVRGPVILVTLAVVALGGCKRGSARSTDAPATEGGIGNMPPGSTTLPTRPSATQPTAPPGRAVPTNAQQPQVPQVQGPGTGSPGTR